MRFLPIILLASVLPCLPLFAGDEKLPPIQQFMSKENADRALNAIIEKYNPDLSYKFKQDALNYLLEDATLYRDKSIKNDAFLFFTGKDLFQILTDQYSVSRIATNCSIIRDEETETIMRCSLSDFYLFITCYQDEGNKNALHAYFYNSTKMEYDDTEKTIYRYFITHKHSQPLH